MARVFIDPGHGGKDSGGVGFGTEEDDIALAVALRARDALTRSGVTVAMSRTGETYPTLQQRCEASNAFGADRFVSIHCDWASNAAARGCSVLYLSARGRALANAIYSRISALTPWPDRGLSSRPELAVLNGTNAVAALVELLFLTNSEEHALAITSAYQTAAGEAIAAGVCTDLGIVFRPSTGPAQTPTGATSDACGVLEAHVRDSKSTAAVRALDALGITAVFTLGVPVEHDRPKLIDKLKAAGNLVVSQWARL